MFRELLGADSLVLELRRPDAEVRDVLNVIASRSDTLRRFIESGRAVVLVNGRPVEGSHRISDGDLVEILPPSAGGTDVRILPEGARISLDELCASLLSSDPERRGGALVIYVGVVKGLVGGSRVSKLIYEVHADYTIESINRAINEVKAKLPGVIDARVYHWEGARVPGEPAVVIAVLAVSREEAFEAARRILERVKFETGIWKLEVRDDGSYWVLGDGERVPAPGSHQQSGGYGLLRRSGPKPQRRSGSERQPNAVL